MMFLYSSILMLSVAGPISAPDCSYDRSAMLALDEKSFDQDMQGGWRTLAKAGCETVAADLIAEWRHANNSKSTTLYWHEGQMRAFAGHYEQATALLEKARKSEAEDAGWGWNIYVDGSVAFLSGDKSALMDAREKLSKLPEPSTLKNMKDAFGNPVKVRWPMNLSVLDSFIRCWGKSYKDAYACPLNPSANSKNQSKRAPEAP